LFIVFPIFPCQTTYGNVTYLLTRYFCNKASVATNLLALCKNVRFPKNGMRAKNNTIYMWREQAIEEWSWHVISIVACCHSEKLCTLVAQAFRSQQKINIKQFGKTL